MNHTTASRQPYFDNLKGILIILVVFSHCLYDFQSSSLVNLITDTIYVFHMPAFVFISGYLSKSLHSRSHTALLKLFSAYLLFNTLTMFVQFLINDFPFSVITPYNSCWYLIALIAWRLSAERLSHSKSALLWAIFAALAAGFFPDLTNVLSASKIVTFFPFFLAGFILPYGKLENFLKTRTSKAYIEGTAILILSILLSILIVCSFGPSDNALTMHSYQTFYEFIIRILLFAASALIIFGLIISMPDQKIIWLTAVGKNSLSIFLFHRIPALFFSKIFTGHSERTILIVSAIATILMVSFFSTEFVSNLLTKLLDFLTGLLAGKSTSRYARLGKICIVSTVIIISVLSSMILIAQQKNQQNTASRISPDRIYKQLDGAAVLSFSEDLRILFAGDLILLEDQVKRAYNGKSYDFSDVFEYAKSYISSADIAIGVFEGPTAGGEMGYSTSNYDDGKTLKLNFPDEFAYAVKAAGFDLVTTANNHLLDTGIPGAMRTLDILDNAGLDHIGSYRNTFEKNRIKIIESSGVKIAVLAYTYGSNGYSENDLLNSDMAYITSLTANPDGENFNTVKASVKADFKKAKAENPDIILVLPHMGTQFNDFPDDYQKTWNELFISFGADLILNDHTHSVQPVEIFESGGKTKVIVNCPGNFANIYREHNGDASAMVEIYIDKTDKTITGASIIPMWTEAQLSGNYRALPIYDILQPSGALYNEMSTYEMERIEEVQKHITKIMLGTELACDVASERYYLTAEGYLASPANPAILTETAKNSVLYQKLTSVKSVCYIGDSITEGSKNGGYGWYRPLETFSKSVAEFAKGGGTVKTILPKVDEDAALYVVALGTNDVRYRDASICAMTAAEYIAELNRFVTRIQSENPLAEFAFIAPWCALENDIVTAVPPKQRDILLDEYAAALNDWCTENGHIYSNPNPAIRTVMDKEVHSNYMVDFIHPNCTRGIGLYCNAVLENSVSICF